MNLEVLLNNWWGRELFEPISDDAKILCQLLKRKTLTKDQLKMCKDAGWMVTVKMNEYKLDGTI